MARHLTLWRVVIGATQLTQLGPEAQVRTIKRLLVHEHYSNITQRNDIALLELDQPVQCGYYVQLACVPDASLRVSQLRSCYVSGWGSTTARAGGPSDVLQEAKVRLIDVKLCNSSRWYGGAIHSHNLCAGYPQGGIDTCQGDSGGPLVCKDNTNNYFWLVGVTSWGRGCARPNQPGVYTSTQHFHHWILRQMGLRPALTPTPAPQPNALVNLKPAALMTLETLIWKRPRFAAKTGKHPLLITRKGRKGLGCVHVYVPIKHLGRTLRCRSKSGLALLASFALKKHAVTSKHVATLALSSTRKCSG
ncbi:acrosin-like [Opisthocomus hoazin]|uniref:acrosin-like n=1 Tax=Opisthocomus hoazin TaxID=30419 RepID=UPI003F52986D